MRALAFSIVIPTYQRRETVCDAVRAIGRIAYNGPVEVIAVVDGSSDGTADALRALEAGFPFQVIEQPNRGAAAARNRGAGAATGEVILFLDDDMMCDPDILDQHAASYRDGADAVLGHIPLDPASPPTFLAQGVGEWAERRGAELAGGRPLELHDLLTGQLSIRRAVFEELGGFDEGFTDGGSFGNEDLDLGIRLLERHDVRFNPSAISRQRYVVTPAQYLRQWRQAGEADVRLAGKHPARGRELFGPQRSNRRGLAASLAARPRVARSLEQGARWLAERATGHGDGVDRTIARLFALARDVAYWDGVRTAAAGELRVLCYHAIADLSRDRVLANYGIPPEAFVGQLDALLAAGTRFVGAEQALAFIEEGVPLPQGAVLLTFDDCYAELPDIVRDVLAPRGVPAIAFAVAGQVGGTNEWDQAIGAARLPLADAQALQELPRLGVEIGCHSLRHSNLRRVAAAGLVEETKGAAAALEALGLPRPRLFAHPYGEYDRHTRQAVRRAGFRAAFGLKPRPALPRSDRFALPRFEVLATTSRAELLRMAGLP